MAAGAETAPGTTRQILVPVSFGELVDKITILEIKAARIADPARLDHVRRELAALDAVLHGLGVTRDGPFRETIAALAAANAALWSIEDEIRDCERRGEFGAAFVALARAVYRTNDKRAALKLALNTGFGSDLVEVKSYASYEASPRSSS